MGGDVDQAAAQVLTQTLGLGVGPGRGGDPLAQEADHQKAGWGRHGGAGEGRHADKEGKEVAQDDGFHRRSVLAKCD